MKWTRRHLLAGAAAPLFAQRRDAAPPRPNIVLILADDLAAWTLGCYGNRVVRTPNMDALAQAGVRFLNSFAVTPACSAARASLFTGRTPRQHGIIDFLTPSPTPEPPQGQTAPPASFAREVMLSDLLSQAGYRCGYAGKWHLGSDSAPGRGFSFTATIEGAASPHQDPVMFLNGSRTQQQGYLASLITGHACDFIDRQQKGSPFFLTVSHLNPHPPYDGLPRNYYDLYRDASFDSFLTRQPAGNALRGKELLADIPGNLRRCAAAITALDDQIPVLRKKLASRGFLDDTIVILTSDHGSLLGRHGLWGDGLASNPFNMYDEVVQTPLIWSWPGRVPVQSVRPELVSAYDLVPTLCEAAGLKAPPQANLCGRSYLDIATNRPLPKGQRWRDLVFGHLRDTEMARDNRFKLVLRDGGQGSNELYDLRADPGEFNNVFDNPQFLTVRDGLAAQIRAWREKYA